MAVVELPFSTFCNRFAGATGWVVGRGPTTFRYEDLRAVDGPVFFINDAVSQERHLRTSHPSFFFAHDAVMATWLSVIRSIAVLPDGLALDAPDRRAEPDTLVPKSRRRTTRRVVRYRAHDIPPVPTLLSWTRQEVARERRLFTQTATIHSVLHFIWFVGCAKVRLIGCDGLPKIGYDPRLPNRSATSQWGSFFARLHQDRLLASLALPAEYVGTPPHQLRLESSFAIEPDRRAESREAMQRLLRQASGIEGCRQASLHQIGRLDVYLARLTCGRTFGPSSASWRITCRPGWAAPGRWPDSAGPRRSW